MSQDSLSDPSKRPQIQDMYKIYQIYLLQQGTVHQFQSQGTAAAGFQRPVSVTLSLFHFVFGTSMEKKQPLSILGNINLIPMVWKDLTYGSRHFWQCPQTICHFPETMRQTIVIFQESRTISKQVTSNMQHCGSISHGLEGFDIWFAALLAVPANHMSFPTNHATNHCDLVQ